MPGPALGGRETAARVDRGDLAEQGQLDRLDPGTGPDERGQGPFEGTGDRGIEPVQHQRARHAEAQRSQRLADELDLAIGQHLVQDDRVAHR